MAQNTEKSRADVLRTLANEKDADLEEATQLAMTDGEALQEMLKGIVSKQDVYRYNCFKVLLQISEKEPAILYPEWDYFVGLLDSSNSYHRSISLRIIANLTRVDTEKTFDDIFDPYFDLLDDEKVITARYLAGSAAAIARHKPYLQSRITKRLLGIDNTHHEEGRKDLIKGDIIQTLETLFEDSAANEEILAFVEAQRESSSPRTRKIAKAFLKKHPN
jgi:hypothetical protein